MSQDNDDSSAFSMDTVSPDCPLKIEDTASDGKLKKLREEDDPEYGIKMEDENEPHEPSIGVAKKKRSSKAMKLENTSKPANTKKPRVTRERALKVAEKMKKELVESYNMGLTEMDLKTLALAAGGYTNPRSDAILAAKAILIEEEGVVEKCKIDKEQGLKLNSKGVENLVPEEPPIASNEAALEKHWTLFEKKLSSGTKTNSSKALGSAKAMWDLLLDGKTHTKEQLLEVSHYKMVRSTGFPETVNVFTDLGLVDKEGNNFCFADKVFPFGRPNSDN